MPYIDEYTGLEVPVFSEPCKKCGAMDRVHCLCKVKCADIKHTFGYGELIAALHYSANALEPCKSCKRCRLHCTCKICPFCSTIQAALHCSSCRGCKKCCKCKFCDSCLHRVKTVCEQHARCTRCQSKCCRRVVPKFNPPTFPVFHEAPYNGYRENPLRRFLSAELEIASIGFGCYVDEIVDKWKGGIVRDGSLSNPEAGFEINTAPANGVQWLAQIREICSELNKFKPQVDASCGLHVHVDARDFTYFDLRKLIFLYEKVEPGLLALVDPSRRENLYCTPCGKLYANALRDTHTNSATKIALVSAMYGSDLHAWESNMRQSYPSRRRYLQDVRQAFIAEGFTGTKLNQAVQEYMEAHYPSPSLSYVPVAFATHTLGEAIAKPKKKHVLPIRHEKYNDTAQLARRHTLNLHSWLYRKTVECRLHHGSVDAEEIINWGMLLGYILEYANKHTEKQIRQLTCNSESQSFQLLLDIVPRSMHDHLQSKLAAMNPVAIATLDTQQSKFTTWASIFSDHN